MPKDQADPEAHAAALVQVIAERYEVERHGRRVFTGMGLTVMMTAEQEDSYTDFRFSPLGTAFLTDAIILQRYVELDGQFKRVMAVVKVRASAHDKDLRLFVFV